MTSEIYLDLLILKKFKKSEKYLFWKFQKLTRKYLLWGPFLNKVADCRPNHLYWNRTSVQHVNICFKPLGVHWFLLLPCPSSIFLTFKLSILGIIFGTLQSKVANICQVLFSDHCSSSTTQKVVWSSWNHMHTQSEMIGHVALNNFKNLC